jgi:nucleoside-diphosphate-sugar epimerase
MCLTNSRNCCLSAPAKPDVLDCVAFDGSRWRAGQDLQLVIVRGRLAVAVGLASEQTARLVGGRGVRTSVVRLPQVHNPVKQGFVSFMIAVAREKGASAYVGEGNNRWSAAHRLDVARLYRLALEKAAAENAPVERYHAVAEEGVRIREIAEAIGRGLKLPVVAIAPEQAMQHFGFLGGFAGLDMPASSALTQERLGWHLTGPSLLADLEAMNFNV